MDKVNWQGRSYSKEEFEKAWKTSVTKSEVARKLGLNAHSGKVGSSLSKAARTLGLSSSHFEAAKAPIRWSRRSYSESEFISAWFASKSKSEVLRKLGLPVLGGNLNTITSTASSLGLLDDHFDPYWTARAGNLNRKKIEDRLASASNLEEILVENSTYKNSYLLKKQLLKAELKEAKCEICGLVEWNGLPAPLALDHINGKKSDNRLVNLRILCYNCHGQTETYSGRKRTFLKNK